MNDVVFNKKESLERCIAQIRNYYAAPSDIVFEKDYMKQDAIAVNLQRACEQCIDMANHVIRVKKLGLVKASRESFEVLAREQLISEELAAKLTGMVGFRNTLVHQYQTLDIELMKRVIENHLDDLLGFSRIMMDAVAA
ncbi:DUF86 domain-containing protein [Mariprofundus sp. EBB-1]|uniref:type VII toxin-antitoxin system HepT family RNase toxin n=1 Tax=Mariprofundus sp. EBB-1 TaxID=2650971 RepID=UPI000EF1ACD2|nr:DUF86 domain-containing protein [Mariprofundus sp. EBB-1]RLL50859.1 DUF86 domain-containing protein [Mariprofundus sp. EBB-1]